MLAKLSLQCTLSPVRTNEINAPPLGAPSGSCGARVGRAAMPGVIALCAPDGREWTVEGRCPGCVIDEPRGANGFGYDPLFVPDGFEQTFAELDSAAKNRISHRGNALHKAAEEWRAWLG